MKKYAYGHARVSCSDRTKPGSMPRIKKLSIKMFIIRKKKIKNEDRSDERDSGTMLPDSRISHDPFVESLSLRKFIELSKNTRPTRSHAPSVIA